MTLLEASKTGRYLKRPSWGNFISPNELELSLCDAIADDWQIEPEVFEIITGVEQWNEDAPLCSIVVFVPLETARSFRGHKVKLRMEKVNTGKIVEYHAGKPIKL